MENKDKPRSEAQVASFKKAHQSTRANALARQRERQILIDKEKALMENKIIQRAIAIKKGAIKKEPF
jgi:outer membrane lipopolysaccharide assembly protein LptE/RlpB